MNNKEGPKRPQLIGPDTDKKVEMPPPNLTDEVLFTARSAMSLNANSKSPHGSFIDAKVSVPDLAFKNNKKENMGDDHPFSARTD